MGWVGKVERWWRFVVLVGLLASACLAGPGVALAAPLQQTGVDWQTEQTRYFMILYSGEQMYEADQYAGFVDDIYDSLTTVFSLSLDTPVRIRLYPTEEDYFAVNPFAAHVPGVLAHADASRREVSIIVPRTRDLPETSKRNNVCHELTHLIASRLSDDHLPTGWQEGVAQYAEQPTAELDQSASLLAEAQTAGKLLPWSALSDRNQIYDAPQVSYPETRAIVAYLVERFGFEHLRALIAAFAQEPGYRSALETVYGQPADVLETNWVQEYLPRYLAGGYMADALYAYDLSPAESLVAYGSYTAAVTELEKALTLLKATNQTAAIAKAEALLGRSKRGQEAYALADRARTALEAGEYSLVQTLVRQARYKFHTLANSSRDAELQAYEHRAAIGLRAVALLDHATHSLENWQWPAAQDQVLEAADLFGQLGDSAGLARSREVMARLQSMQRWGLLGVLGVAAALGVVNLARRLADLRRQPQLPESGLL